jgi:simple sugar transport system ATP-binding protein
MTEAIIVDRVSKSFGPTQALADVSLTIGRGESRGLIGKNGAGKSTLMSILTGLVHPDSGTVRVLDDRGRDDFSTVGCVYQRSTLVPGASAAENISLGRYPRRFGLIRWDAVRRDAVEVLAEWGCAHLADHAVDQLDPLERKIVEICRVLSAGPKVLLLDEPTAGLDRAAAQRLFEHMEQAHQRGVTTIYVSHHLHEVFKVCDSVSVLRDGKLVLTEQLQTLSMPDLVEAMVGETIAAQEAEARRHRQAAAQGRTEQPVLVARELTAQPKVRQVDLELRAGECVGLTGLDGAGHMQVAEVLTGQRALDEGTVTVDGRRLPTGDIHRAVAAGVGFTPEDRHLSGYIPGLSVAENTTLGILSQFTNRFGVLNFRKRDEFYRKLADKWDIKAHSPGQAVEELSGGNQQKVVLARSVAADPRVLVLMNPTAGVDVSAKDSIYATIDELKRAGQSVLLATSDDGDLEICDRILVMFDGEVVAEMHPPFSETEIAAAVQGPGTAATATVAASPRPADKEIQL